MNVQTNSTEELLLSIIVCTYNRHELLFGNLKTICSQIEEHDLLTKAGIELILVDNNSSDLTLQTFESIRTNRSWMRYIFEPTQGLSYARNRGFQASRAKYCCYLDDDAIIGSNFLLEIVQILKIHRPDFLGGPIFPYFDSPRPFWFRDELETRMYAESSGFQCVPISGGNFTAKREILEKLGGHSTKLGMVGDKLVLGEERELLERYCLRTPLPKIYYSIESYVFHYTGIRKMTMQYQLKRCFASGRLTAFLQRNRCMSGKLQNLRKGPPFVPGDPSHKLSSSYRALNALRLASFLAGLYYSRILFLLSDLLGKIDEAK